MPQSTVRPFRRRPRPAPPYRSPLALLLALLAALLVAPRPASAQGTAGQVPDPISSRDLVRWLDRYVRPTAQQWEPIDRFHDQYKEEFARLREGEIERFLEETKIFQSGQLPTREATERWAREWRRVNGRVKALDTRLFEQIQTVLDEQQLSQLPRVRLARQRDAARNPMSMGLLGAMPPADLTELVSGLELSRDEFAALSPDLVPYEEQYTKRFVELSESTSTFVVDLVEALNKAGFGDIDQDTMMNNPERAQQFMEQMQRIWAEIGAKSRESAFELTKLNHRARKLLAARMSDEKAARFRRDFAMRGYPTAFGGLEPEPMFRAALRMSELDDARREAIQAIRSEWRTADARAEDALFEMLDEIARTRSPMDFMQREGGEETEQKLAAKREERLASANGALERLRGVLGPELAERLDARAAEGALEQEETAQAAEAVAAAVPEEGAGESVPFYPGSGAPAVTPIRAREIARWSAQFGLDEGGRAILESIHADYLERWNREVGPATQRAAEARSRTWTFDEGRGRMNPAAVEEVYSATAEGIAASRSVDRELFENIRIAVVPEGRESTLDGIELARDTRVVAGSGPAGVPFGMDSSEHALNVAEIAAEALPAEIFDRVVLPALRARLEELRTASRELDRVQLDQARASELLGARLSEIEDGEQMSAMAEYQREISLHTTKLNEAMERRRTTVRALVEEIVRQLPAEQATALRGALDRAAYPGAWNDANAALPFIERAKALGELSEGQRVAIERLEREYRTAYDAECAKIVEIFRETRSVPGGDPAGWQEWQERRNRAQRIEFTRDELSMKAVRSLRDLLGDSLAEKVPGLAGYGTQENDPYRIFR